MLRGQLKHDDVKLWELDNSIKYLQKVDTEYKWYKSWKYKHPNTYKELLNKCNNKCEICGFEFTNKTFIMTPHLDHNHLTGYIRGILCNSCNPRLGCARDNPIILQSAKIYLIEHN